MAGLSGKCIISSTLILLLVAKKKVEKAGKLKPTGKVLSVGGQGVGG